MTGLETLFASTFFLLYLALLATVAVVTWRRGNKVLFFLGFLLPILWLFGAVWGPDGFDFGGVRHSHHDGG